MDVLSGAVPAVSRERSNCIMAQISLEKKPVTKKKYTRKAKGPRPAIEPLKVYTREEAAFVVGLSLITIIRANDTATYPGIALAVISAYPANTFWTGLNQVVTRDSR